MSRHRWWSLWRGLFARGYYFKATVSYLTTVKFDRFAIFLRAVMEPRRHALAALCITYVFFPLYFFSKIIIRVIAFYERKYVRSIKLAALNEYAQEDPLFPLFAFQSCIWTLDLHTLIISALRARLNVEEGYFIVHVYIGREFLRSCYACPRDNYDN